MSGGHFDYQQYRINDIIEQLERDIDRAENGPEDSFYKEIPEDIVESFKVGLVVLKMGKIFAERIDYYLSGDDGEESYRTRLEEDLAKLEGMDE